MLYLSKTTKRNAKHFDAILYKLKSDKLHEFWPQGLFCLTGVASITSLAEAGNLVANACRTECTLLQRNENISLMPSCLGKISHAILH